MHILIALLTIVLATSAGAFQPVAGQKSVAEQEIGALLEAAATDSVKKDIAKSFFNKYPDDIPGGRIAQDILLKNLEDPITFFKKRLEQQETLANRYWYGRASRDSVIMAETAKLILNDYPDNYWGHELAGYAEWYRAKPDTGVLIREFRAAIKADPSRPEAYLYLGWVYWDEEQWPEMREALEAGAIADPTDKSIRDARLTVYAEQRDADAFFTLMQGVFSDTPLTADLPRARGGANLTTAELRNQPTVIEYWAYT
ncbi:MAG: tetratricopeptide repeat protein [Calditrichota bacterium]